MSGRCRSGSKLLVWSYVYAAIGHAMVICLRIRIRNIIFAHGCSQIAAKAKLSAGHLGSVGIHLVDANPSHSPINGPIYIVCQIIGKSIAGRQLMRVLSAFVEIIQLVAKAKLTAGHSGHS